MHTLIPHTCPDYLFETLKKKVAELELDDRQLKREQFLTLDRQNELFAFGRLKEFSGFSELCTLGVTMDARHLGLAKRLVRALSASCTTPLYTVCIIPSFFENLGFSICSDYPIEMAEKLDYCTSALPVPEKYVVMRRD